MLVLLHVDVSLMIENLAVSALLSNIPSYSLRQYL